MGWPLQWKTVTDVLSKTILQLWLAKGPRPIRVWGKDGITWPNIVAGGQAETKARVALATERSGHPLATEMQRLVHVGCSWQLGRLKKSRNH
jgi:hypothetical protein